MKVSAEKHEELEKNETPGYEAKEHGPKFLKKAAKLASKRKEPKKHEVKAEKKRGSR